MVHRPMPKPDGFDPNRPGPPIGPRFCEPGQVRSAGKSGLSICERQIDGPGFRLAAAHGVRPLGRCTTSPFASFLVDRLAKQETE